MNDILQIVIHAMIRISVVKPTLLKPSCFFVHQNMSAADADEKLKINRDAFLANLDEITKAAAEKENIDHMHNFRDVINYDEKKFAFYMPDAWQGQPPMAPVNHFYSEKVKEIKDYVTSNKISNSNWLTITKFITRLEDLWDAILRENFVFSFKNSEEIKAFSQLDRSYTQLCWSMNDVSLRLQIFCQNKLQSVEGKELVQEQQNILREKIISDLHNSCYSLKEKLEKYFDKHENRNILEQWRERYRINLESFRQDEQTKVMKALHTIAERRISYLQTTNETNLHCQEKMTDAAIQAAKELRERDEELNDDQLMEHFNKDWKEWTDELDSKFDESKFEETIASAFRGELLNDSFLDQERNADKQTIIL